MPRLTHTHLHKEDFFDYRLIQINKTNKHHLHYYADITVGGHTVRWDYISCLKFPMSPSLRQSKEDIYFASYLCNHFLAQFYLLVFWEFLIAFLFFLVQRRTRDLLYHDSQSSFLIYCLEFIPIVLLKILSLEMINIWYTWTDCFLILLCGIILGFPNQFHCCLLFFFLLFIFFVLNFFFFAKITSSRIFLTRRI